MQYKLMSINIACMSVPIVFLVSPNWALLSTNSIFRFPQASNSVSVFSFPRRYYLLEIFRDETVKPSRVWYHFGWYKFGIIFSRSNISTCLWGGSDSAKLPGWHSGQWSSSTRTVIVDKLLPFWLLDYVQFWSSLTTWNQENPQFRNSTF